MQNFGSWCRSLGPLMVAFLVSVPYLVFALEVGGPGTGGPVGGPVVPVANPTNIFFTLRPLFGGLGTGNGIWDWISAFIPFMLTLSVLFFLWGLAKFVYRSGDEKSHAEGRAIMIWGVIAIFIFVSIWGIVRVILNSLGLYAVGIPGVSSVAPPGMRANTFADTVRHDIYPLMEIVAETLVLATWLVFFYGIARFLWALSRGDEEDIANGKLLLVWGVIIVTVSVSFWGMMSYLAVIIGATPHQGVMLLFPQFRTSGPSGVVDPGVGPL